MRILFKKDEKIGTELLKKIQKDYGAFIEKHTGIVPEFYTESIEYNDVTTELDADGDRKPDYEFRKNVTDDVYERYNQFGVDHIILLVHEDNWVFDGIWGTNWSNVHHSYHVSLVRWDRDNMANTFGTLYHEMLHSLDALVKTHTGVNLSKVVGADWDKFIVHGGRPDKENTTMWEWVNYKQNTEALQLAAPHLIEAYTKRKELHEKNVSSMKTIINILRTIITLFRAKMNKKDGVPKNKFT